MNLACLCKDGSVVVGAVELARSLFDRMRGALGRRELGADRALHIAKCGSIHTFFMRFSLDVVFLDRYGGVVRVVTGVGPWRVVFGGSRACSVVELDAGALPEGTLLPGDSVVLVPHGEQVTPAAAETLRAKPPST